MASNYDKMAESARQLFLSRDSAGMIKLWGLEHDGDFIYADYIGDRLRIDRRTAEISSAGAGFPISSAVNETMVLFDLLTHPRSRPLASGEWASISVLGGIIGAGHDRTLRHEDTAAKFAGNAERLARACARMGEAVSGKADVEYSIPVFADFRVLLQFWDADDEFPASIKYLFDRNALQYMHYETLWYVMNSVAERAEFYFREDKR